MAGELTMRGMSQLDIPGSIQKGQALAGNALTLRKAQQDFMEEEDLDDIRDQAVSSGYDPEKHKQLLMDSGYFEEALDLDEMQTKKTKNNQEAVLKGLDVLNRTAQMTSAIGEPGWQTLRGALINAKFGTEESLPQEYNDQAQNIASKLVGNTDQLIKVLKYRSGDTSRDMIVQGGKVLETGDPYSAGKSGKDNRGAFEKQIDADTKILRDNFTWLDDKSAKLIAREQYFTSKHRSDADAAQRAMEIGNKESYGDPEETDRFVKKVLELRKKMNDERIPKKPKEAGVAGSGAGGNSDSGVADPSAIIQQARDAIGKGADKSAVAERLKELGVDPGLLGE